MQIYIADEWVKNIKVFFCKYWLHKTFNLFQFITSQTLFDIKKKYSIKV